MHRIGWSIIERIPTNESEYYLGGWRLKRSSEYEVEFSGFFDGLGRNIKNPSLEKAGACFIKGPGICLYFYRKGKMWDEALAEFVEEMNNLT